MSSFIASLDQGRVFRFTVGDLVEGLLFLDVVWRRAALFGLEQRLSPEAVTALTPQEALQLKLTTLAQKIFAEQVRHIRLNCLFWQEMEGGLLAPLRGLESRVSAAFAGMEWATLQHCYNNMALVDAEAESEDFMRLARAEGLL